MAGLLPFSSPRPARQTSPRPGLPFIVGSGREDAACSGGRVLRARTPDGIGQEVYAPLVTYQALRTAIADAASTVPGTDPDRASFTVALGAARDQVTQAAGVLAGTAVDLTGTIGRRVLASLMPVRRLRVSPRVVKRAMSRYNARGEVDRGRRQSPVMPL